MKKLIIFIGALMPLALFAQVLERQVISSTGGVAATSNMQVSSTVGETMVSTTTSNTIILTQGFQQPGESTVGIEAYEAGLSIKAYPNPTKDQIIIEFNVQESMRIEIELFDTQGRKTAVKTETLDVYNYCKKELSLASLAPGNYVLLFRNTDGVMGTIKLQKIE